MNLSITNWCQPRTKRCAVPWTHAMNPSITNWCQECHEPINNKLMSRTAPAGLRPCRSLRLRPWTYQKQIRCTVASRSQTRLISDKANPHAMWGQQRCAVASRSQTKLISDTGRSQTRLISDLGPPRPATHWPFRPRFRLGTIFCVVDLPLVIPSVQNIATPTSKTQPFLHDWSATWAPMALIRVPSQLPLSLRLISDWLNSRNTESLWWQLR